MDVSGKVVWQQAAGDNNRNYVSVCLDWDVILNGTGRYGPWPEAKTALQNAGESSRKIDVLKRFNEEMKNGDIVVLKVGTKDVYAVGEIVGDPVYNKAFSDVDGWNMGYCRRVRWLWKCKEGPISFNRYDLKFGDTTQKLISNGNVMEWLNGLDIEKDKYDGEIVELPDDSDLDINFSDIANYLYNKGASSLSIDNLEKEIGELTRIASWYDENIKPSEHETIAYLAIPLLRILGWTPQKMGIEWKNIDIALFSFLPRNEFSLSVVFEAKRKGKSCLTAFDQAKKYANKYYRCRMIIVSDGIRYAIFNKNFDDDFVIHSYMNLTNFKQSYPIYKCAGVQNALLAMTPEKVLLNYTSG